MDKREQREMEQRRVIRRKRRQRQIIRRCLLFIAGLIVLGFGARMIGRGKPTDTVTDDKNINSNQTAMAYPTVTDNKETNGIESPKSEEPPEEPQIPCIVLDAGHGGTDPGTLWGDIYEKDINLAIAKKLEVILKDAGYQVVMTRDGDDRTVLKERVRIAEKNQADAFVSIHQNALEKDRVTEGIQVFYNENSNKKSEDLADSVHTDLLQATGAKDKGLIGESGIFILKNSTVPACLVETGFLSTANEREKLLDEEYQQKIAEGIAEGIIHFLDNR